MKASVYIAMKEEAQILKKSSFCYFCKIFFRIPNPTVRHTFKDVLQIFPFMYKVGFFLTVLILYMLLKTYSVIVMTEICNMPLLFLPDKV